MILDSFLRGLHSERKFDFSGILFTSDRRGRVLKNIALFGLRNYNAPQCVFTAEEFKILKNLKNDNSIFVLKSDKGNGIVILNRDDYYSKMETILNDSSNFKLLEQDPIQMTFKRENKVRRFFF